MNSDILFIVFGYLNIKDLLLCSVVCKEFNEIANHNVIWKQLFIQQYNTLHFIQPSYKQSYEICYKLTKFMKQFNLAIDLDGLNKLSEISLSCQSLTEIPKELSALANLQELYLNNNNITEIPKELSALTNLQELYLFNNQITEIPKELSVLTNLQLLTLYNNKITEIPKELTALTNLQWLNLSNNKITEIPKELRHLPIKI